MYKYFARDIHCIIYLYDYCISYIGIMRILLLALITLGTLVSVYASGNTTETPSSTYNETVTPALIVAGTATIWTYVFSLALVIIIFTGGVLYCNHPTQIQDE